MLSIDLHTHTVASGHGTADTVTDLARSAAAKGMHVLGISDHGPATPGSCSASYFRSLRLAPRYREGIRILYGAEANILDENGHLDLPDDILEGLDYVIASIHPPTYRTPFYHADSFWNRKQVTDKPEAARESNTAAYLRVMENPYVKILGHVDDQRYPADYERLVEAAASRGVLLEINEGSLAPGGFRGSTHDTDALILRLCAARRHPVLLSSDSHGAAHVGDAPYAEALIKETDFPEELIINRNPTIILPTGSL